MLGQNHHFNHAAPQTIPYAIERYQVETQRLYHVLNKRLETRLGWEARTTALRILPAGRGLMPGLASELT